MTLWTPANLAHTPHAILDGDAVPWSGSNFATVANPGAAGGSISQRDGTTTKGTAVNGHETLKAQGTDGLTLGSLSGYSFGPEFKLFVVGKQALVTGEAGGLFNAGWASSRNSVVVYPMVGFDISWNTSGHYNPALFAVGDGYDSAGGGPGNAIVSTPNTDAGLHLKLVQLGLGTRYREDGVEITLGYTMTGACGSITGEVCFFEGQPGAEFFTGETAWLGWLHSDTTDAEIEKLEGWASWTYVGDGSLLPSGHPYKSAAPTMGGGTMAADAAIAETADTVAVVGALRVLGAFGAVEAADTLGAAGGVPLSSLTAGCAITEAGDMLASIGAAFKWSPIEAAEGAWTPPHESDETWTPSAASAAIWS